MPKIVIAKIDSQSQTFTPKILCKSTQVAIPKPNINFNSQTERVPSHNINIQTDFFQKDFAILLKQINSEKVELSDGPTSPEKQLAADHLSKDSTAEKSLHQKYIQKMQLLSQDAFDSEFILKQVGGISSPSDINSNLMSWRQNSQY